MQLPAAAIAQRRVVKGGASYYEAEFARPPRGRVSPRGQRLNVIGFRVARTLE